MERPKFTPHTWHSKDGKWKFRTDEYGMTDIYPVLSSPDFDWSFKRHLQPGLFVKYSYKNRNDHIHWAE